MRRPRRLRPGDRVAVVCPGSPVDPGRLHAGCAVLSDLGLEVVLGAHVLDRQESGYLAGTDRGRARDLEDAWCDPAIAAIVCARGGYGAARVLDLLSWEAMAAAEPKVLLGASDVTALHAAFAARLGVVTLFGPMPATAGFGAAAGKAPDPGTLAQLRATLFAPEDAVELASPDVHALVAGRARGVTTGGTLSLVAGSIGCPESSPATGAIALFEDIGEQPYRIDRLLTQLLRSGWFAGVAGVVTGTWTDCGPVERVEAVLRDRLSPLGVPVLAGLSFGHGPRQLTVPLGVEADLDADAGTLTLTAAALR
ncbi:LD-carboxypeptidase [Streptomyces sp. SID5474]|nr:LD-carboxypeptidase [Streptomyces sp. SID5474]